MRKSITFEAKSTGMAKSEPPEYRPINAWAEEDRPREKMLLKGREALSDAELLAILLGSGTRGISAVDLAREILKSVHNNLHELGRRSIHDLKQFKGMGEAKAITIAAALELGRRRQVADLRERPSITCSRDAYHFIAPLIADLPHEEFWLLMLNRRNEVIRHERISSGGMHTTTVDPKILFQKALMAQAAAIIAVHNHPSGSPKPSQQDIELTQRLRAAGKALQLPLLDHIIVGERAYYSFADEGLLPNE